MDFLTLKQKEINNLLNLKSSYLGLNNFNSSVVDYKSEFEVLDWTLKDKVKRLKLFVSPEVEQKKVLGFALLLSSFEDRTVEIIDITEKEVELIFSSAVKSIKSLKENKAYNTEVQDTFFPLGVIEDKTIEDGLVFIDENADEFSVVGIDFYGDQYNYSFRNRNKETYCVLPASEVLISGSESFTKTIVNNIVSTALDRADKWKLYGLDSELSSKYQLDFYDETEVVKSTLRKVKKELQSRYELLDNLGNNNLSDVPEEMFEILDLRNVLLLINNVDKIELDQEDKDIIKDILRLGRAAKVSIVLVAENEEDFTSKLGITRRNVSQVINCLDEETFSFTAHDAPTVVARNFK